jgi:hypothetical protein
MTPFSKAIELTSQDFKSESSKEFVTRSLLTVLKLKQKAISCDWVTRLLSANRKNHPI